MKKLQFVFLGVLFGFLLSRAGATTYDFYAKLFLFQDPQLFFVIAFAVAVGAPGVWLMKKTKLKAFGSDSPIEFKPKPYKGELIPGALLFGLGWGLAGACPGTILVMAGEGKVTALFTIVGILLGTWVYGLTHAPKAA
ncbi:MAG: hypothetical protein AUK47_25145 [Deltaproteobacteria bacterium CG2_30_63_29]|nr:MAG: hypothetical protein AUK47_25145 [Deltaproteobacteria bacterium CG2_30_63_29]PIV99888.1 MAG: hypothetical protein COW42_09600 [Deltaproteobacteria bacterium CG17_big_fil_post_rev_8_21_14_2_50_63_7]PJB45303.1 MAG: hypothetical protein CO108_07485 [Deltaproteobacteria bacterium CG_4_9_14_3_um_filter_63_12]